MGLLHGDAAPPDPEAGGTDGAFAVIGGDGQTSGHEVTTLVLGYVEPSRARS